MFLKFIDNHMFLFTIKENQINDSFIAFDDYGNCYYNNYSCVINGKFINYEVRSGTYMFPTAGYYNISGQALAGNVVQYQGQSPLYNMQQQYNQYNSNTQLAAMQQQMNSAYSQIIQSQANLAVPSIYIKPTIKEEKKTWLQQIMGFIK